MDSVCVQIVLKSAIYDVFTVYTRNKHKHGNKVNYTVQFMYIAISHYIKVHLSKYNIKYSIGVMLYFKSYLIVEYILQKCRHLCDNA